MGMCPGKVGTCPGKVGTCPGKVGTCPGKVGTCPGKVGTCPGKVGTCPGKVGTCPGKVGTCPGKVGTCPGKVGMCPGTGFSNDGAPYVMQGVEVPGGDGVVPHTPVLNERRQLVMAQQRAQTIPSTPADQPAYVVPQLAESSVRAVTSQRAAG